ncbi:MAG: hypothetical protein KJ624_08070 [Chloroflexi bacterium]|nr:hypothetical protein [Chloroflexota bacterium]
MTFRIQKPVKESIADPDPSWKGLYKAGGISVALYIAIGIIAPAVLLLSSNYDASMDGIATLEYIAANKSWWITIQALTLGPSALAIVPFIALYAVLKHVNKSYAAIGVLLAIASEILFLAYFPVVNGLVYLSDKYVAATTTAQRTAFASAAEALVAQNNAYGPSEIVLAGGILIISLIMLKGVFHKGVAYLGIATFAAAIIGAALKPILAIAYLWWWALFMVWFAAVGWKLYRLGAGGLSESKASLETR